MGQELLFCFFSNETEKDIIKGKYSRLHAQEGDNFSFKILWQSFSLNSDENTKALIKNLNGFWEEKKLIASAFSSPLFNSPK